LSSALSLDLESQVQRLENEPPSFPEDLAFGTAGAGVALGANIAVHLSSCYLLNQLGYTVDEPQDVMRALDGISAIASPFLQLILKVALVVYIVLLAPLFEEYIFRDKLWSYQESDKPEQETFGDKAYRVVSNGVIFGAVHLSPAQGVANIPIFLSTMVGGVVMAALRQWTGNSRAAKVCHVAHNSASMTLYALGI